MDAYKTIHGDVVLRKSTETYVDRPMTVSCGNCPGCRAKRAEAWGVRAACEALLSKHSSFLTFTYAPAHLPEDRSLNLTDWKHFCYRFRQHMVRNVDQAYTGHRFIHSGEYGDLRARAHHHAIFFHLDLRHDTDIPVRGGERPLWRSPYIESLWQKGEVYIGPSSPEACNYIGQYCVKKRMLENPLNKPPRGKVFLTNRHTGEQLTVRAPYVSSSRYLGRDFLLEHWRDIYQHDTIVIDGRKHRIPAAFDKYMEDICPETLMITKKLRQDKAALYNREHYDDKQHQAHAYRNLEEAQLQVLKDRNAVHANTESEWTLNA